MGHLKILFQKKQKKDYRICVDNWQDLEVLLQTGKQPLIPGKQLLLELEDVMDVLELQQVHRVAKKVLPPKTAAKWLRQVLLVITVEQLRQSVQLHQVPHMSLRKTAVKWRQQAAAAATIAATPRPSAQRLLAPTMSPRRTLANKRLLVLLDNTALVPVWLVHNQEKKPFLFKIPDYNNLFQAVFKTSINF